jgi:hypothetical protein
MRHKGFLVKQQYEISVERMTMSLRHNDVNTELGRDMPLTPEEEEELMPDDADDAKPSEKDIQDYLKGNLYPTQPKS